MSAFDDKSKDAQPGFYLTLVSIMQSLALGYLLQVLGGELVAKGTVPLDMVFQGVASLLTIILVWHQYAIGTVAYRWKLDIFDSTIPFLVGIGEYLMIAAMGIPESKGALSGVRFSLWLWSVCAFAFVSIFAYWNQYGKAELDVGSRRFIAASRMSMFCTIGYCGAFALLAFGCSAWGLPERLQWVVSLCVSVAFLLEVIRVELVYASATRRRGAKDQGSRFKRGLLRV
jgi:hypothetical protein